jgi:hypothetical protein
MSAGVNFNASLPDGDLSTNLNTGRITFAPGTNQGLFDPLLMGHRGHVRVVRLQLFMTGQTTWSLSVDDPTSVAGVYSNGVIVAGTTETFVEKEYLTIISPGQRIKLVTVGAGTTAIKMVLTLASALSPASGARGF